MLHAVRPWWLLDLMFIRQGRVSSPPAERKCGKEILTWFALFPPVLLEFKRPLAARLLPGLGRSMSSVHVRM